LECLPGRGGRLQSAVMTQDRAGTLVDGRYRLVEVVGEGGMAVVWRAQDTVLARTVAIKLLRPQYAADPEFVERFRSEARAAAPLNHPGIVAVYDVGNSDDGPYLVLELVEGQDLKQLLRTESPLAPSRTVDIASAVAHAVHHAHMAGLVHRDIKPQNVLIATDGRVKVADFGIARAVSAVGATAPGIVLGTVHYLAPEQASGGQASPASDVYSLGVVAYEMLTGSVPHDADSSVGVAMKIVNEDAPPADASNPRVPAVLAGIVAKAMARRPEDRYPNAGSFAEALDSFARWSDQSTGALRPVPKQFEPVVVAPAAAGFATPPVPAPRPRAADGPLLDGTGLLLAVVALLAVAGLVPLWATVLTRVEPARVREVFGAAAPTAVPRPTDAPTATPESVSDVVDVPIPDLRQVPRDQAELQLTDRGLRWSIEVQESVTTTAGVVMDSKPRPGGVPVPSGTVVKLFVSGEQFARVPDLLGHGYQAAAETLLALGLEPVRRDQWGGSESPAGTVLMSDPQAGARLPQSSPVFLTVNSGSWLQLGVDFADHVHLSGISLGRRRLAAGEVLSLAARWEATGDVVGSYRTVAALVGPGGVIAREAHVPLGLSTTVWNAGNIVENDGFNLLVPPGTPAGEYQLVLGLETDDEAATPVDVLSATTTRGGMAAAMRILVVAGPTEG
jgi:eukaryotic-like serine/threonine-protein kinase